MNNKEKFIAGVKAGYKATFHKGYLMGKMGYLHDELEIVGNDINYMDISCNDIRICKVNDNTYKEGLISYLKGDYKKAIQSFEKISPVFQAEKNYLLAVCNIYGRGVRKNIDIGVSLLKDGVENSLCCKQLLARCYIEGTGVPLNKKKAYELLNTVLTQIEINKVNNMDEDYLMPDLYYFCGEYELEMGDTEKGLEHLKKAAVERNFGLAYYILGKYYYESNIELAKNYFNKAKKLNVNVSTIYYQDERSEIADEPIDFHVSDKIGKLTDISQKLSDLKDNIEKLDWEKLWTAHLRAKNERIDAQTAEKVAKGRNEAVDTNIKTTKTKAETEWLKAETDKIKREIRNDRWKQRQEKRKNAK